MEKQYPVFKTNMVYLILGVSLYFLGSLVQKREVYSGLLITEYILVLLPNILYIMGRGGGIKSFLRLNRISLKQVIYTILIVGFSYPVAVLFNFIGIILVNLFTNYVPVAIPIPDDFSTYILSIFIIGITPGICEEVMFRGTIMRGYESLGRKKSIVYSAILFGFFHFDIQKLIGPIFLGLVLGILVYKSNSIYSSILGHTVNNSVAMTIGYMANIKSSNVAKGLNNYGPDDIVIMTCLIIGFIVLSSMVMVYLIKNFPVTGMEEEQVSIKPKLWEFIPVVLILLLFIWVNARVYFNLF